MNLTERDQTVSKPEGMADSRKIPQKKQELRVKE